MRSTIAMIVAILAAPAIGRTKSPPAENAPSVEALLACRAQTEPAQRLACFDGASASLAQSITRKDVVVVNQAQVREAKHSLFGFNVGNVELFRSDADDKAADRQVVAKIRSASLSGDGNWLVTLDTGAVWQQTDGQTIGRAPRPGDEVTVVRGTLGAYFMRVGKQPGVKVRRVG